MQIDLHEVEIKSTSSKEYPSRQFDTGVGSDDQKNHDPVYFQPQNSHPHHQNAPTTTENTFKQNRAQTSSIQQPVSHRSATLANKKQYIESIRLSYLVLSNPVESSPEKKKKKPAKKSFVVISEEEDNDIPDQKIKESLKSPLKIDLKKFQQNNNKFIDLSDGLQMLNNHKFWEKCHMNIDSKTQELVLSNLHIPFVTITKIKIYKKSQQKSLKEVKVTYEKGSEEGVANLGMSSEKYVKKMPGDYTLFQEILVSKLTFQNRYKETKWDKKEHIFDELILDSYIFGEVYKKSKYWGKWQKRFLVLNGKGIFSYKSTNKKEEHTFCIERESIEEMWTRFEMIDGFLIIKIRHGLKKTEFGIPVTSYSYPHYKNWLYYFYKLMVNESF